MNTKEKAELREVESLYDDFFGDGYWERQYKQQIVIFANKVLQSQKETWLKELEHPQPLDAGELEEKFAAVTNYIRVEVETGLREAEDYGLSDSAIEQCAKIAQSFAQASITAKQKEQHIIHEELISGMGEKTLKMFDDGVDENVIDGYQMALNEVVKYLL